MRVRCKKSLAKLNSLGLKACQSVAMGSILSSFPVSMASVRIIIIAYAGRRMAGELSMQDTGKCSSLFEEIH